MSLRLHVKYGVKTPLPEPGGGHMLKLDLSIEHDHEIAAASRNEHIAALWVLRRRRNDQPRPLLALAIRIADSSP